MNKKVRAVGHQIRRQSRVGKTGLFRGVHVNECEQSPLMMSLHSQRLRSKAKQADTETQHALFCSC